jgi:hypothetical protein
LNNIFIDQTTKKLNTVGTAFMDQLVEGPLSIKQYPLIRKAGMNYFVFALGSPPEDWPADAKAKAGQAAI